MTAATLNADDMQWEITNPFAVNNVAQARG
jgi:hypothetical protein